MVRTFKVVSNGIQIYYKFVKGEHLMSQMTMTMTMKKPI
jgi:hypothetical protein